MKTKYLLLVSVLVTGFWASGCAFLREKTRTVFVPEGDPVIIAEDLKDVRVLAKDGQGRLYYDHRNIPEGWVALPVPELRGSTTEVPGNFEVQRFDQ